MVWALGNGEGRGLVELVAIVDLSLKGLRALSSGAVGRGF